MNIKIIKNSPVVKTLEIGMRAGVDQAYFETRKIFNKEQSAYLSITPEFNNVIEKIRQDFVIPILKPESDIVITPVVHNDKTYDIEESRWINKLTKNQQKKWGQVIDWCLQKYGLPVNSKQRLISTLLYRCPFAIPDYDFELVDYIVTHLAEIRSIHLTTGEKKYILDTFKFFVRNNPRIDKVIFRRAYTELKNTLQLSKNTRRRNRTFKTSLKSLQIGEYETAVDNDSLEQKERKVTSQDLASRVYRAYRLKTAKKKAQTLRKQKQRLRQRVKSIIK
jgi:hypothetical protein